MIENQDYVETQEIRYNMVDGGFEEVRANAHLIAAAPELYEACKVGLDLVKFVVYEHPDNEVAKLQKELIEKALAKAEGR